MPHRPDPTPPDPPTTRERVARRLVRMRHDLRRFRRAIVGLGALLLVLLTGVAVLMVELGREEAETVPLGRGEAGVDPGLGVADVPEGHEPPEPPPPPEEGSPVREIARGLASFYHRALEGRPTASGEAYRGAGLTAAHRTLPFGTRLRVTNLANGRSVVVRVNDRGPFVDDRVIDVSRAAAEKLGILRRGEARVKLELLEQ